MGIALSAMSEKYIAAAEQYNIPFEVMHRVIAMASGEWIHYRITVRLLHY